MAKIERFEDIEAWKKARELTKFIYEITGQGKIAADFSMKDQLRRASVSIMANIAEGFEREGNKEFRQFLAMAKGQSVAIRRAGCRPDILGTASPDYGAGGRDFSLARRLSAISESFG
jgi:hypothetical protein